MPVARTIVERVTESATSERAILVAQIVRASVSKRIRDESPLNELGQLARSSGAMICAQSVWVRRAPVAATFIGRGAAQQLAELVQQHCATLVIFDHPISPVQERNLERIVGCRVLDRSGLILDIFAQRAVSREGKLQVELAQLKHLSTRLVRGWSHLERQKGGIGLRGPGETQLETDRRLISARMQLLARRLRRVSSQRELQRRARVRAEIPLVSLVGYTNAGKSTLFNRLAGQHTPAEDRLFVTLDPTMRRVQIPDFGAMVLSDTVGFIRELPHALIAAFHSTLEELTRATCLLLVNDCADGERDEYLRAVEEVLLEIGADAVPRILVNNKIDCLGNGSKGGGRGEGGGGVQPKLVRGADGLPERVWVSAQSGAGVDLLQQALGEVLAHQRQRVRRVLVLKPQAGALRARLYQRCQIAREEVGAQGEIRLCLQMDEADFGWLRAQGEFAGLWVEEVADVSAAEANN